MSDQEPQPQAKGDPEGPARRQGRGRAILRLVCVYLVCGVLCTYGAAWGISAWHRSTLFAAHDTRGRNATAEFPGRSIPILVIERHAFGMDQGYIRRAEDPQGMVGSMAGLGNLTKLGWSEQGFVYAEQHLGWPWPAVRCWWTYHGSVDGYKWYELQLGSHDKFWSNVPRSRGGDGPDLCGGLGSPSWNMGTAFGGGVYPWVPVWAAFACDVGVYGVGLAIVHFVLMLPRTIRRRRLGRVGLCQKCRYSLEGLSGSLCPECGTPRPSEAQRVLAEAAANVLGWMVIVRWSARMLWAKLPVPLIVAVVLVGVSVVYALFQSKSVSALQAKAGRWRFDDRSESAWIVRTDWALRHAIVKYVSRYYDDERKRLGAELVAKGETGLAALPGWAPNPKFADLRTGPEQSTLVLERRPAEKPDWGVTGIGFPYPLATWTWRTDPWTVWEGADRFQVVPQGEIIWPRRVYWQGLAVDIGVIAGLVIVGCEAFKAIGRVRPRRVPGGDGIGPVETTVKDGDRAAPERTFWSAMARGATGAILGSFLASGCVVALSAVIGLFQSRSVTYVDAMPGLWRLDEKEQTAWIVRRAGVLQHTMTRQVYKGDWQTRALLCGGLAEKGISDLASLPAWVGVATFPYGFGEEILKAVVDGKVVEPPVRPYWGATGIGYPAPIVSWMWRGEPREVWENGETFAVTPLGEMIIPRQLYWRGLAIDLGAFAAPAFVVILCFKGLRREWRRRRGRCPHCGYSMAGLGTGRCPECGAAGSGRAGRTSLSKA